ncbi:MAG TPA: acylphosphatase [Chloroflexi bacterium]|nr:acylphosphatase [Chloroflexota bacterium]HBY07183.1 acylphosphatase [Chloroflexota bacterium]
MNENQMRLHAVVEGRVQGVGFRYFTQERAVFLGLTGWVRNRWDGTVEVVAEGPQADIEILLKALQRGPRAGTTQNVKFDWLEATGEFSSFRIRQTE